MKKISISYIPIIFILIFNTGSSCNKETLNTVKQQFQTEKDSKKQDSPNRTPATPVIQPQPTTVSLNPLKEKELEIIIAECDEKSFVQFSNNFPILEHNYLQSITRNETNAFFRTARILEKNLRQNKTITQAFQAAYPTCVAEKWLIANPMLIPELVQQRDNALRSIQNIQVPSWTIFDNKIQEAQDTNTGSGLWSYVKGTYPWQKLDASKVVTFLPKPQDPELASLNNQLIQNLQQGRNLKEGSFALLPNNPSAKLYQAIQDWNPEKIKIYIKLLKDTNEPLQGNLKKILNMETLNSRSSPAYMALQWLFEQPHNFTLALATKRDLELKRLKGGLKPDWTFLENQIERSTHAGLTQAGILQVLPQPISSELESINNSFLAKLKDKNNLQDASLAMLPQQPSPVQIATPQTPPEHKKMPNLKNILSQCNLNQLNEVAKDFPQEMPTELQAIASNQNEPFHRIASMILEELKKNEFSLTKILKYYHSACITQKWLVENPQNIQKLIQLRDLDLAQTARANLDSWTRLQENIHAAKNENVGAWYQILGDYPWEDINVNWVLKMLPAPQNATLASINTNLLDYLSQGKTLKESSIASVPNLSEFLFKNIQNNQKNKNKAEIEHQLEFMKKHKQPIQEPLANLLQTNRTFPNDDSAYSEPLKALFWIIKQSPLCVQELTQARDQALITLLRTKKHPSWDLFNTAPSCTQNKISLPGALQVLPRFENNDLERIYQTWLDAFWLHDKNVSLADDIVLHQFHYYRQ